jgi:hypothetical protein
MAPIVGEVLRTAGRRGFIDAETSSQLVEHADALARATGADVAASDDATGSVVAGGDWQLETQTGPIEASSLEGDLGANTLATYGVSIGQNSGRLYWQGRSINGARYAQPFTDDKSVAGFQPVWRESTYEYAVPTGWFLGIPTRWGKRTGTTRWQENEYRLYNYGSGTRFGTSNITLSTGTVASSTFQFDVTPTSLIKNWMGQGQDQGTSFFRYNFALYKDSFDPSNPLRNLVSGGESNWGGSWVYRTETMSLSRLQAGNYIAVLSYNDYILEDNYNAWWANVNLNAEQLWGSFNINVTNLNRAPSWGTGAAVPSTASVSTATVALIADKRS